LIDFSVSFPWDFVNIGMDNNYRSLFENSPDPILITTPEGEILDANRSSEELFGYAKEELRSMNVVGLYAEPADRENVLREFDRKGFIKDYEVKMRKKDRSVDCLLSFSVIDMDGRRSL
jgi:PAS domain S-box-containing protein